MGKSQGCVEFILHAINRVFTVMGVIITGIGLVYFLMWKQNPSSKQILYRMLLEVDQPTPFFDQLLPKTWFISLIIGFGATLIILSCFGYVGATLRSPCCLFLYCLFLVKLVILELGIAAFIFFKHNWKEVMPKDISGSLQRVYHFMNNNWKVMRWVTLGIFSLQVIATVVAICLRSVYNKRAISYRKSGGVSNSGRPNYQMLRPTNTNPSTSTTAGPTRPTK